MKFKIDNQIFEKFPELVIGVVVAKGIDNKGESEEITKLIREKEKEIRESFNKEDLSSHPNILSWRKAYFSFGAKPKNYKCSVENLYRMILDGIELKHINKIVDIYNYISIKHIVPVGGDDIDKIDGDIVLKLAIGDETFKQLNTEEIKSPKQGEVIYSDDKEVLCRRWNWRECDKSKMTEEISNAILVVEGLPPFSEIDKVTRELSELVSRYCSCSTESHILNKVNSLLEIIDYH